MVTTTNLDFYFKSDENAANTTVNDANGSNDGIATVNTSVLHDADGIFNSSFNYNGSTEYIDTNFSKVIDVSNPISVSFWFKTTITSRGDPFGSFREGGSVDPIVLCYVSNVSGKIGMQVEGDGSVGFSTSGSTTINDGSWHHALVVVTTTSQRLYLDGNATAEISGNTNTGNITLTGTNFFIGATNLRGAPAVEFTGNIDEVGFWNEELGATEAAELYNSGAGLAYPFSAGPIGWLGKIQGISPSKVQSIAVADIGKIQGIS